MPICVFVATGLRVFLISKAAKQRSHPIEVAPLLLLVIDHLAAAVLSSTL